MYLGYRREQRLGSKDIATILTSGRRLRGNRLLVQVRENGLDFSRLGLIVPRRFLPLSVDRNLMKRHVREWFRLRQANLKGRDVLVRLSGRREVAMGLVEDLDQLALLG